MEFAVSASKMSHKLSLNQIKLILCWALVAGSTTPFMLITYSKIRNFSSGCDSDGPASSNFLNFLVMNDRAFFGQILFKE